MADVQKSAFALSSATIMIGKAFVDDVFSLQPSLHSVGMVNQAAIGVDSSINELLNGVSQSTVDAKRTGVSSSITGNVFEMTAQNFMRSQAMSGSATQVKRGVLATALAANAATISINSDPIPGESASAISNATDIPSGSTILIQRPGGETDYIFPTMSSAAATGTGTGPYAVAIAGNYVIPTGMTFPAGSRVWIVAAVGVGDIDADDVFCVKVTGTLSSFDRPLTYIAPKVRMVKGFAIAYNETSYSSMPWEMKPLLMSVGETTAQPRLAEIGTRRTGRLYVGG